MVHAKQNLLCAELGNVLHHLSVPDTCRQEEEKYAEVTLGPLFTVNSTRLGMCSFQHKWASERRLYLFVLLHHVIMK